MTDVEETINEHTEYGVNVSNKFAFLDDDNGDPAELLARAVKEKKAAKQQAKAKAAAPPPAPVVPVKNEKENNENRRPAQQNRDRAVNDRRPAGGPRQPRGGDKMAERFGEKPRDENRAPRRDGPPRDFNNRPPRREGGGGNFRPPRREGGARSDNRQAPVQNNDDAWGEGGESQPVQDGGERPAYGGGKPRTFQRGGPRRFDRVSGSDKTGVRPQAKKQGHGPGNWGTPEDQLAGETDAVNQTVDENKQAVDGDTPLAEGGDENAATGGDENADGPPKEEEPPKMTLEEWKAQHASAKVEFKTRQANEGADDKSLQKFVPLKREETDEKKAAADEENKKKKGQRSNVVSIELSFNDPNRREYGGGRRGGDRDHRSGGGNGNAPGGSRGPLRGGPRVPHHSQKLDSNDFPALGAR